jgi:hypothetical protein
MSDDASDETKNEKDEFFRQLERNCRYKLKPVEVIPGQYWRVSNEFKPFEIELMLSGFGEGKLITFQEAYKTRWLEGAVRDSWGEYWIKTSKFIRTPILKWARERGFKVVLSQQDIEDFKTIGEEQ